MTDETEAYIPGDLKRSVLSIEGGDITDVSPITIGTDILSLDVANLSDLGVIGGFLEENISQLGVPIVDDEYDVKNSGLKLIVLDENSIRQLSVEEIPDTRVFLVENPSKKIKVLFRVPELDVAEVFATEIKNADHFEEEITYLSDNKNLVNGSGDRVDFLDYSRRVYGVWKYAVKEGYIDKLDSLMVTIYPEVDMPKEPSVVSLIMYVRDSVKTEEGGKPAENWWKARLAVNELVKVVEKNKGLDKDLEGVLEIIRVISEKTFYPDQLWKLVIEPLMNEYCGENHGINRYEKKAFLEKVMNDGGVVWLNDVPGFKSIVESEE